MMAAVRLSVALTVLLPGYAAGEPPELEHNPFARPPSVVALAGTDERRTEDGGEPVVIATLVSDRGRLANVDGNVLRPGDEIYGYRLVQVYEDRAIFVRQGRRTTVLVKPQLDESDE